MPKVKKFKKKVGSRRQVWNRTAKQTPGGLKRKDLYKDKYGSLQSRKSMKKSTKKSMKKTKKNKYRKSSKKSRKSKKSKSKRYRKRNQRGGDTIPGVHGAQGTPTESNDATGYVNPSTVKGTLASAATSETTSGSLPTRNPTGMADDGVTPEYGERTVADRMFSGLNADGSGTITETKSTEAASIRGDAANILTAGGTVPNAAARRDSELSDTYPRGEVAIGDGDGPIGVSALREMTVEDLNRAVGDNDGAGGNGHGPGAARADGSAGHR